MNLPAVHLLVFEGFADWEPAYAAAELRRSGGLEVVTVGFTTDSVRSMGGLRVLPDRRLAEVEPRDVRLLILPGGDMWEGEYPRTELEALLGPLERAGTPIAAICGATLAVARAGLLNERAHTSNELNYLRSRVPSYAGADRYVEALAVRDGGLITASGVGPTEFAREIFAELGALSPDDRALWYQLFKHGRVPSLES
jgi:putative intracellular protease/amidase